jgi:hypothetical protein
MTQRDKPTAYRVGYKKPPQETRFKKGRSGNPKGRPKGTLNLATVLERTLRELVVINENGRRKVITKLAAAVKQMVNKAASGDLVALRQLLALVISAEERANTASTPASELSEVDRLVMQSVIRRFESNPKGGSDLDANA